MSNRAWRVRRSKAWFSIAGNMRWLYRQAKARQRTSSPGYGMGMGANTLIHKGRKP